MPFFDDTDSSNNFYTAMVNRELMKLLDPEMPASAWRPPRSSDEPEMEEPSVPTKSSAEHVLEALNWIDAPKRGLAGAAYAAINNLPIWDTAKKSFMGEREIYPSDVLGLPRAKPGASIPDYIGAEGQRMMVDMVLDPTLLASIPIKGVTLATRAARAARIPKAIDWFAGTKPGKDLVGRLPVDVPENRVVEDMINLGGREAGLRKQEALEAMSATKKLQEASGLDPKDVYRNWEITPEALDPKLQAALLRQEQMSEALAKEMTERGLPYGQDPADLIPLGGDNPAHYIPRVQRAGAIKKSVARPDATGPGEDIGARKLWTVLAPEGEGRVPLLMKGEPQIVKTGFDELERLTPKQIQLLAEQGLNATHRYKGQAVRLGLPTLEETERVIPGGLDLVTGAPEAYTLNASRKAQRIGYNITVDALEKAGEAVNLPKKWIAENYPNYADLPKHLQEKILGIARREAPVPKGWRYWETPGYKDIISRKSTANRMENLWGEVYDQETSLGSIGSTLKRFFDETSLGRGLKDLKSTWVGTTLPLHPAWQFGNVATNQGFEWMAGVPLAKIPVRNAQMRAVQSGSDLLGEAIPGLSQAEALKQMAARNVTGPGALFGTEPVGDVLQQALTEGAPSRAQRLFQALGLPESIATKAAYPFEKLGAAQDWGYRLGSSAEENAKGAVFINEVRNALQGRKITDLDPREAALILDRAGESAKIGMAAPDYLTPFHKQLRNVMPFVGWTKGAMEKLAETALYKPWKLSQMNRAADFMFTPLSAEEKAYAPDYLKESGPIKGILGQPLDSLPWMTPDPEGNPLVTGISRYTPTGQLEQIARPFDFLGGMINPSLKSPQELFSNRSAMKNRAIDELAGGFPANIVNPMLGLPHQKGSSRILGQEVPASVEYIASQLPGGRYLSEINEALRVTGLAEDPNKRPTTGPQSLLWWIFGGKSYPLDEYKNEMAAKRKEHMKENTVKYLRKRASLLGNTQQEDFYDSILDQLREAR